MESSTHPDTLAAPRFPGYRVQQLLHEGRRNRIYRARSEGGQAVLLSVLCAMHPVPAEIAWLGREHDLLARLSLPGVSRVLGLEQAGDRWAMVLEDGGGQTLAHLVDRADTTLTEKLRIAMAVVSTLGQLHERMIVHKSLQPGTILWHSATQALQLVDLGDATVLPKEVSSLHSTREFCEALYYIAPEQTGRISRSVDYRADFYALGVVLYELFTGHRPFSGDDPLQIIHSHIARHPVAPSRRSGVPEAISGIIMHLLAKTPEARYQSTFGLQADLQRCLDGLEQGGASTFDLMAHDVSERFHVPEKLYGRDSEIEVLLSCFRRAVDPRGDRAAGLVLISGYSGIGKTALAREVYGPVHEHDGYFISGKFDQLQRSSPYSQIISAFRDLIHQLLRADDAVLSAWQHDLRQALGDEARVITELIPALELIVGEPPPLPDKSPAEARARFNRVFHRFVSVFPAPSHPLVIFLDDLQWADAASLDLLEALLVASDASYLLVIGAYRDHEVGPGHPLLGTLDALAASGVALPRIELEPLDHHAIAQLISDTVRRPLGEVEDLTRVVERKTLGNPLFVIQMLESLAEDGLLTLDRAHGCWRWNPDRVAARGIADDVVDLVLSKLRRLPEGTQHVLRLAACLGSRFGLDPLAAIAHRSISEAFERIIPAIQEGFVVSLSSFEVADPQRNRSSFVMQELEFSHDRIQQAAYGLIPEHERESIHLSVGRVLRDEGFGSNDEGLFQVVDQLNRGREGITDPAETLDLARLNLEAGRRAQASLAYAAADTYLGHGIACLPPAAWERAYPLTFELHRIKVDIELLCGHYEQVERHGRAVIERAQTLLDKARVFPTLVNQYTFRAMYADAFLAAQEGLALLGVDLPFERGDAEVPALSEHERARVERLLGDRSPQDVLHAPAMTDPQAQLATSLLLMIMPAIFLARPVFYPLVVFKATALSLQHGPPASAADLFCNYGHILSVKYDEFHRGYEFGQLAIGLTRRFQRQDGLSRCGHTVGVYIVPWARHLREVEEHLDLCFRAGIEGGERLYAGYGLIFRPYNLFYRGCPLEQVAASLEESVAFNRQTGNEMAVDMLHALELAVTNQRGATAAVDVFELEGQGEVDVLERWASNKTVVARCYYTIVRAELWYLRGEPQRALDACREAEPMLGVMMGHIATAHQKLYLALSLAALHDQTPADQRAVQREELSALAQRFERWAASCPENFGHLHALVRAEIARIEGRWHEAAERYEEAIEGARAQGFGQHVAMASERAGEFWLGRGARRVAAGYLGDALEGQRARGAVHEVERLQRRHGTLLRALGRVVEPVVASGGTESAEEESYLDLGSVLKASRAIAGELVLDRLLDNLMHILLENAGARQGAIVFSNDGDLVVRAQATMTEVGEHAEIDAQQCSTLVDEHPEVDAEIVRFVARTHEPVILGDAVSEGDFRATDHVVRRAPKSILCAPLLTEGRLLAIIYLENNLTSGAFTTARLEMLRVLSAQIAISIENALLYREIENRVEQRTHQLHQRNQELQQTMEDLRHTQDELVQSEKLASMGRLALGVAHELRNPLNFIINFAVLDQELIDDLQALGGSPDPAEFEELIADLRENSARILEHGRRSNAIVTRIMKQVGENRESRVDVDLDQLVGRCVERLIADARQGAPPVNVTLRRTQGTPLGIVRVLSQSFEMALTSIVENAVDAMRARQEHQGPGYEPILDLRVRKEGAAAVIEVEDNGVGIPKSVHGRVFEPFFTTKPPGEGTGLGLSLAYEVIVNNHRGKLEMSSIEGTGSTFRVAVPLGPKR